MGNAPSSTQSGRSTQSARSTRSAAANRKQQTEWDWEYRNGRLQPKARVTQRPQRPLFKKQPSNNYEWWIFNPNSNKRSRR